MVDADDLLAALDPEQREVADALRGPVRVLAGAGTGKTRAITHRIAYGVATGVYEPTEVLAVTFTTRAAGEMRGRLRRLGAPGVQAQDLPLRRPAPAALLLAPRPRHRAAHAHRVQDRDPGHRRPTQPDRRRPGAAARPGLGDRVGQGQQRPSRRLRPGRAVARPLGRRPRPRDRRARLQQLRGRQAHPGPDGHGGRPAASPPACSPTTNGSPPRSAASTNASSSTSSRTSPRSSRPCSTSGWAAATSCAWSATRRRRSTPSPAPTRRTSATSRPSSPRTTSIELTRNYRSTPEVVAAANTLLEKSPSRGVELRAQRPAGRPVTYTPYPDEVAEAEAVAERIAGLRDDGRPPGEVAVLFRINAQSEAFEEALASRGIPYVVRGAARFFDRPEVRQAVTLLRGTARSGQAAADGLVDTVRAVLAGLGWSTEAPDGPGPDPRPLGVPAGPGRPGHRVRPGRGQRPGRLRRRPRPAGLGAARPGRRRRHPGHAARRQGARVGLRLRGRPPGGHAAVLLRRVAHRGRGGAPAALRRDDPRPARPRPLLEPGPQPGRAGLPQALPLPRSAPPSRRHSLRRARPAAAWSAAASAGSRSSARPRRPAAARTARRPTTRSCSSACASGARPARRRRACPRSWSSPTPRLQLIAEHKPRTEQALLAVNGIGRAKLERYGDDVLALLG